MDGELEGLDHLVIGSVVGLLGLVALAVAATRWRSDRLLVASFGAFALLYGLRLFVSTPLVGALGVAEEASRWIVNLATYVINVPAWFFFRRLLGAGWRGLVAIWLGVMTTFAIVAVASDLIQGRPGTLADWPNSVLVIVGLVVAIVALFAERRKLDRDRAVLTGGLAVFGLFAVNDNLVSLDLVPWSWHEETVGFLLFLGCLGFITARKVLAGEQQLAALEGELEAARRIQASLLPASLPAAGELTLAARFRPSSAVAGDFYEVLDAGPGRLGVLVADVSGHGVPAALVASMVKVATKAHRERVDRPADLLAGMHGTLRGEISRGFVTAVYAFFDAEAGEVVVARAGHPAALLVPKNGGEVVGTGGVGPILARFPESRYAEERTPFAPGDRLVLFTDGLVEARSPAGEMFGEERLGRLLAASRGCEGEVVCDALLEALRSWTGGREDLRLEDDLTLVIVDRTTPGAAGSRRPR